jgi:hypothetical protein
MVNMDDIISKFQTIFNNMKQEKGSFYVFMILKMDEYINKWSIVVSTPWISRENQRENFIYIVNKIRRNLTLEESATIARLGLFQPDEHMIRLINQSIRVETGTAVKLENTKLNGYLIHEAYIFESIPPVGFSPSPSPSPSEASPED